MKTEVVYFSQLNEDIEFLIGKNSEDNFNIIDISSPNDIWFHLNDYPSCHVIAKVPDKIDRRNIKFIIKKGALLCKENSKYKSNKNLDIIYTKVKNVKKTNILGTVTTTGTKIITI